MKKSWLGVFLLSIFVLSFVSAQGGFLGTQTEKLVNMVTDFFGPIFAPVLGGQYQEFLFEKILFFFIILSLIYVAASRVPVFRGKSAIIWTITLCVSILSTRYITEISWVKFILLPYNVMGIALLTIIPFIIYTSFIESFDSGAVRKMGWALYIVLYISMWYTSFSELGDLAFVYFFAAILGGVMLLADKRIRSVLLRSWLEKGLTSDKVSAMVDLKKEIKELEGKMDAANGKEADILLESIAEKKRTLRKMGQLN